MFSNNELRAVAAYTQRAIALFRINCTFAEKFDRSFNDWNVPGNRGPVLTFNVPSLFVAQDGLKVDFSTKYTENFATLTATKTKNIPLTLTDEELATYPLEKSIKLGGESAMAEMATVIDGYLADIAMNSPFRWYTDADFSVDAPTGKPNIQNLCHAISAFREYGSMAKAHCALPNSSTVDIQDSGLQRFTPVHNDKSIAGWEIGTLVGAPNVSFYNSFHLKKHISGTAAGQELEITAISETTHTIPDTNITKPATNITVTVPEGQTILENDLGDIGRSTGLQMIRPVGHDKIDISPQIRVIEANNASTTSIVLKVFPALVPPNNGKMEADTNMSRPINVDTDKLRIVGTHRRGCIWLHDYAKFAMPKLPGMKPFLSNTASDPNSAISVRMYSGALFGEGQSSSIIDSMYGGMMVPEGGMIICLPA